MHLNKGRNNKTKIDTKIMKSITNNRIKIQNNEIKADTKHS